MGYQPRNNLVEDENADLLVGSHYILNNWKNYFSLPNLTRKIKLRRMRWVRHVARIGEKRNGYKLLVGKPDGKRPLGRQRHKRADTIKMDLGEVGYGDIDWIGLVQDRDKPRAVMNAVMNFLVL
jgi:hypothetical protein